MMTTSICGRQSIVSSDIYNYSIYKYIIDIVKMDCVFNRYIPKSAEDKLIIRPGSKTWFNGMAESYSYKDYDPKLMEWHMS